MKAKVKHTQTRWYFTARRGGDSFSGYVEFAVDANGRKRADVYDRQGSLKWSTWAVVRRDLCTAKMAFEIYVNEAQCDFLPARTPARSDRK